MEVVIYGLRAGYKVLYNKSKYNDVADDLRPSKSINDVQLLGQSAYSVSFSNGAYILTKHIITYDYSRGFSPLNFSIVIPNNQRIDSEYAKSMLDKLESTYSNNYLIDYYNKEQNENWSFIDEVKAAYQPKLYKISNHEIDNFSAGKEGPAYLYYDSEKELLKYFKYPYQDEFEPYKLVYLIDSKLEGSNTNTLNALKHDPSRNLTGIVDFSNKVYRLKNFVDKTSRGIEIKVCANNKERNHKNNRIKLRDTLHIEYSKPYYHSTIEEGSLNELKDKGFIIVNEEDESISIKQDVVLEPIIKNIKLNVEDWSGRVVPDPIITIRNNEHEKPRQLDSSTIEFRAEKVKQPIIINANKNHLEGSLEITPENVQKETITITLHEKKSIKFTVPNVPDNRFNLIYNGKRIRSNEITFNNSEIYAPCTIEISSEGYESNTVEIIPNKEQTDKVIELKRRKRYSVSAGEHGTLNKGRRYFVYNKDGSDVLPNSIIPNKGYKHTGFTYDEKKDKVIATYREIIPFYKHRMFLPLSLVLLVLLLGGGGGAYLYLSNGDGTGPKNIAEEAIDGTVKNTLNGTSANASTENQDVESELETESNQAKTTEEKNEEENNTDNQTPPEGGTLPDERKEDTSGSQIKQNGKVVGNTEETTAATDKTDWTKMFLDIIVKGIDDNETKYIQLKELVVEVEKENKKHEVVEFFNNNLINKPNYLGKDIFIDKIRPASLEVVASLVELKELIDKYAQNESN